MVNIARPSSPPPGLCAAICEPVGEAAKNPSLVTGAWVMRCASRTVDDIRKLGGNDPAEEPRIAAARAS